MLEIQHYNATIVIKFERLALYKEAQICMSEIVLVPLCVLTRCYVFRIYDGKSGILIVVGETTFWESLAENLARHISKKLSAAMN